MHIRILSWLIAATISLAAFYSGALDFIERPLLEQRFKYSQSPTDSRLIIVEIDPKSLRDIGTWPWKRSLHALLIDRLTAAEAATVAFDIDFSLPSSKAEDKKLEAALKRRQNKTILAAFRQWSEADGQFVDIEPIEQFARHSEIASVNIFPESDGLLWRQTIEMKGKEGAIPSLAWALAKKINPSLRSNNQKTDFWIDYGISLDSFERYSFSDVASGIVDPIVFKGKIVLIGATAIELGDNVAVPVYKSVPGVMAQTLAAQSLMSGRALTILPVGFLSILIFAVTGFISAYCWKLPPISVIAVLLVCNTVLFSFAMIVQSINGVLVPTAPIIAGTFFMGTFTLLIRFRQLGLRVISERIARLKSQALLASVAQNAFDALITLDRECRIKTVNLAAKRIFEITSVNATKTSMSDFYLPSSLTDKQPFPIVVQQALKQQEPFRILCKRATGKAFHADLAVTRIIDEEEDGLILLIRDIDKQVKAEKLSLHRARELERAKTRAELANRAKTEFLANMSHELKTPLNAIMGFAEVMQGEMFGPIGSPKYIEYSKDIYKGGSKLLESVTDVLDFARIEDGNLKIRLESVDLAALVKRLGNIAYQHAEKSGITVLTKVPDKSLLITTDERLLKQSLNSVISNAIKFNREGGSVCIELIYTEGHETYLTISDTGIGISKEDIEKCFQAFGQVDTSLHRQYEGSGLGLTLARKYIETLNGTLQIASEVNEGSIVTITLPSKFNTKT